MSDFQGVTAVSWGPWRAAFLGDAETPIVQIRTHDTRTTPGEIVAEVPVDDPTEAGLRRAILALAEMYVLVDSLRDANPAWAQRLGVVTLLPVETHTAPAATPKTAKKKAMRKTTKR